MKNYQKNSKSLIQINKMDATHICDQVLSVIKESGLNFKITETAFFANITIKKTMIRDKNGANPKAKSKALTVTPTMSPKVPTTPLTIPRRPSAISKTTPPTCQ